MACLPRFVIPGQPRHIIQRGNNRQALFGANADYRFFRGAWVEAATRQGLAIHADVWMTHHSHVLATPESGHAISQVLQSVGRRYVQYFNAAYGRSGALWEGRYRTTVVDSERYLLTLMRYLELNVVRAGGVTDPAEYPWSSYRHPALGEPGPNADGLTPPPESLQLGRNPPERQRAYRQLFHTAMALADLADIRDCSHKVWALGGERFKEHIESLAKRRATSKELGRPRKENNRV